jgi:DNA-binding CsgD family transcriptional regulator
MMLVHRLASAQPLQVLVAPLPHRNDPLGLRAAAVAFISDPSVDSLAPEDVLRHSFGLTRAEARLVSALVSGVSVADYAGMNERSRNTVRSQLKSAMAKLGVRRQADLVRVLLAVPRVGRP